MSEELMLRELLNSKPLKVLALASELIGEQHSADWPHLIRAEALLRLQEFELAIEDCNHLLLRDPNNGPAYTTRGIIHRRQRSRDLAMQDLTRAIELSPNDFLPYAQRSFV